MNVTHCGSASLGPRSEMRIAIGSRGSLLGSMSSIGLSVPSLFGRLSLFGRTRGAEMNPLTMERNERR